MDFEDDSPYQTSYRSPYVSAYGGGLGAAGGEWSAWDAHGQVSGGSAASVEDAKAAALTYLGLNPGAYVAVRPVGGRVVWAQGALPDTNVVPSEWRWSWRGVTKWTIGAAIGVVLLSVSTGIYYLSRDAH